MPALHTPASIPRSQCRRDALSPRPVQIRTSQPQKEVVSGSLSPRDAELLVVRATDELYHISGGNCLIAYLYVLVSPRLCRIGATKACLSFLINQLQLPSSTPLISFACNACSFLVYIYILQINLWYMQHYGISLRALLVDQLSAFNEFHRFHNKRYDRPQTAQGYFLK